MKTTTICVTTKSGYLLPVEVNIKPYGLSIGFKSWKKAIGNEEVAKVTTAPWEGKEVKAMDEFFVYCGGVIQTSFKLTHEGVAA